MNKVSHLYHVAATAAEFVVLPDVFIVAREHQRSHSYARVFGELRDPEHAVRIALLWNAFKRQVEREIEGGRGAEREKDREREREACCAYRSSLECLQQAAG